MKVIHIIGNGVLHLEPESETDQATINSLYRSGSLQGCGRDPRSNKYIHAQVKIAEEARE